MTMLSNNRGEQSYERFRERQLAARRQALQIVFGANRAGGWLFSAEEFAEMAEPMSRTAVPLEFFESWINGGSIWIPEEMKLRMVIADNVSRALLLAQEQGWE